MARRDQGFRIGDLFDLLKVTPTWFGPALALAAYVFSRFIIPLLTPEAKPGTLDAGWFFRTTVPRLAWLAFIVIFMAWVAAEIWKLFNRRLLDRQTCAASIQQTSWPEFERLVSEAYRRRGYVAEVVGRTASDGGVDVRLTRGGELVLVQCEQWRAWKVGVSPVRELLGVVVSERANKGILVTSGTFTREAKNFAAANPRIELVDGQRLPEMIREAQADRSSQRPPTQREPAGVTFSATPTMASACPTCGSPMVERTARKGRNAGSNFLGCTRYPACRGYGS